MSSLTSAKRGGVAWLCRMCRKYTQARDAGIAGQECMAAVASKPCGSPLVGMSFPEYEGEVSAFQRFCFVCGSQAKRGMKARGSDRVFGVCEAHGPAWATQQKAATARPILAPEITYNGGGWIGLGEAPRKKGLQELMLEFDPHTFDPIEEP